MEQLMVNVFNFGNAPVRVVFENDQPLWIAKDVCDVLGIEYHRDAVARLDDDQKGRRVRLDGKRGEREMATINESGVYDLILRSNKPEARAFRKWVTSDLLPKLRKTGKYEMPSDLPERLKAMADTIRMKNEEIMAMSERITMQDNMLAGQRQLTDILCRMIGGSGGEPNAAAQHASRRQRVTVAVTVIPETMRRTIEALQIDGFNADEIAVKTGVALPQVEAVMRDSDERDLETLRQAADPFGEPCEREAHRPTSKQQQQPYRQHHSNKWKRRQR